MKKTIVDLFTGEIQVVDLTPEEISNLPDSPDPEPQAYPTGQIVQDRATGEPYEVFVENGVLTSEPLGDSNG